MNSEPGTTTTSHEPRTELRHQTIHIIHRHTQQSKKQTNKRLSLSTGSTAKTQPQKQHRNPLLEFDF